MSHNTSRLALPIPDATDNESGFPAVSQAQMTTLDNAALFLQGTLASRPAFGTFGRWYLATDDTSSGSAIGTAWFDTGSAWTSAWNPPSRGAVNIAASQSTSSTTYTTLTTPDQVTGIVVPTNGKVIVSYQATWQESVSGAGSAALFLGGNQIKIASNAGSPLSQAAGLGGTAAQNAPLFTSGAGLVSFAVPGGYTGDVTTGQLVGGVGSSPASSGEAEIFGLPAGTYTVSVQFKASSGTVTVLNRKLWVEVKSYT